MCALQFCQSLKEVGCKQEKHFLEILHKLEDSVLADISAGSWPYCPVTDDILAELGDTLV